MKTMKLFEDLTLIMYKNSKQLQKSKEFCKYLLGNGLISRDKTDGSGSFLEFL